MIKLLSRKTEIHIVRIFDINILCTDFVTEIDAFKPVLKSNLVTRQSAATQVQRAVGWGLVPLTVPR